jgi:flagellar biosynthesis protein FlhG
MLADKNIQKAILAVGGGKGGTGKSFLSANLAIELGARQGDVIIIDGDLGGPNLHTFLSVRENGKDLGDFVKNNVSRLEDILTTTSYPGLRFIRGSENSLFLANLNHFKKLKLIRQIKTLPAERVIIDLGTGSAYNTLDLFVIAKPGILIVTPEPTAVENTYYFLKSCAVRILKLYARYYKMADLVQKVTERLEDSPNTLRAFLDGLASADDSSGQILLAALKNFKPYLVVNKARSDKDVLLGRSIVDVVRKYFLIEIDLLGTIPYDERVHWSLKKFAPFILEYPESSVSETIKAMVQKLASEPARSADKNSSPQTV